MIEEGTHDSLLLNTDGAYFALVNAQQLSMDGNIPSSDVIKEALVDTIPDEENKNDKAVEDKTELAYKRKSFVKSFGHVDSCRCSRICRALLTFHRLLMYEQRQHWLWYAICK